MTLFHMCLNCETKNNFSKLWHQVDEACHKSWGFGLHQMDACNSWVVTCIFTCIFYIKSFWMCFSKVKTEEQLMLNGTCFPILTLGCIHWLTSFRWMWIMFIFLKVNWYLFLKKLHWYLFKNTAHQLSQSSVIHFTV